MQIPEDKLSAIREVIYAGASRKTEAIKLVREATGCGLKEAKDFVKKRPSASFTRKNRRGFSRLRATRTALVW
jgi:ribosomal protein L7/L12